MLYAIILAGGRGERFWPKSRRSFPKQFLRLFSKKSLLELTYERITPLIPLERQLYVVPRYLLPPLKEVMPILKREHILVEPEGKNTAPSIALAALHISKLNPETVMLILPADHLIEGRERFYECIKFAEEIAEEGYLVTFGIPPTRPDTGYGYIEVKGELERRGGLMAYKVKRFTEKPEKRLAEMYVKKGDYFWNSGMFVFKADSILSAFSSCLPEFYDRIEDYKKGRISLEELYRRAPSISIDYGIMEKAENIALVKANFVWDDVGSWLALERHLPKDLDNNAIFGKFYSMDTKNMIVYNEDGIVVGIGVQDLVIVKTKDVVLVCKKDRAPDIKNLLRKIEEKYL